jgi:hypothetical protein
LCKTLLGLTLLGYPTPTLLAWGEEFNEGHLLAQGSHKAKVHKVADYLKGLSTSQQNDLVVMLDAYDVQFQLPFSTMLDRYEAVTGSAQTRLDNEIGHTVTAANNLSQTILFGAGKRCAPNHPHEVACWAIPMGPLPLDLYGTNTDTVVGRNIWWSTRQRYLNSGFIMGPAGDTLRLFEKASADIRNTPEFDPLDPGDHFGDWGYHGSDQAIFNKLYGYQEWMREAIRIKNSPSGTRPNTGNVYAMPVDNVLNPSFDHENTDALQADLDAGRNPYEFGIHLDFFSDFTHQTINSEIDAHFLRLDNLEESLQNDMEPRLLYDCPVKIPKEIPRDMQNAILPGPVAALAPKDWMNRRLYTHVCTERFPLTVHHNGQKEMREQKWDHIWYVNQAREMLEGVQRELADEAKHPRYATLEEHKLAPRREAAGGAWTDKGDLLAWEDLCPMDRGAWEWEIFRDFDKPS